MIKLKGKFAPSTKEEHDLIDAYVRLREARGNSNLFSLDLAGESVIDQYITSVTCFASYLKTGLVIGCAGRYLVHFKEVPNGGELLMKRNMIDTQIERNLTEHVLLADLALTGSIRKISMIMKKIQDPILISRMNDIIYNAVTFMSEKSPTIGRYNWSVPAEASRYLTFKGNYEFKDFNVEFNGFPIMSREVNKKAEEVLAAIYKSTTWKESDSGYNHADFDGDVLDLDQKAIGMELPIPTRKELEGFSLK